MHRAFMACFILSVYFVSMPSWASESSLPDTMAWSECKQFGPSFVDPRFRSTPSEEDNQAADAVKKRDQADQALKNGKMKQAQQLLEEALKLLPDFADAEYKMAIVLRSQGQAQKSLELLTALVKKYPCWTYARMELAKSFLDAGQLVKAHAMALEIDNKPPPNPLDPPPLQQLALEYCVKGELSGCHQLSMDHLERHPDQEKSYLFMGRVLKMSGAEQQALDAYLQGLERLPNSKKLLMEAGLIYHERLDSEDSIPFFERLYDLDPNYPGLAGFLASDFTDLKDRKQADAKIDARLKKKPNDPVWGFVKGVMLYYDNQYPAALTYLQKAHKHFTTEPRSWIYLAMAHFHLGHQKEAEKLINELIGKDFADPDANYCAFIIYSEKDPKRAIKEMQNYFDRTKGASRYPPKVARAKCELDRVKKKMNGEIQGPLDLEVCDPMIAEKRKMDAQGGPGSGQPQGSGKGQAPEGQSGSKSPDQKDKKAVKEKAKH